LEGWVEGETRLDDVDAPDYAKSEASLACHFPRTHRQVAPLVVEKRCYSFFLL